MKMYEIEDVKPFMGQLLLQETFDKFCVSMAEIRTLVSIRFQGNLRHEWLLPEEAEKYQSFEYVPWKLLRPIVFDLVKGKQTPEFMKIQFVHYRENGDCGGLRIQYEAGKLSCLSSYTSAEFSLERNQEIIWDENCLKFLSKHGIVSTQL